MTREFIAADIGGTNARLALVRDRADATIEILARKHYRCAEYHSLQAIVADFMGDGIEATTMAIGFAGMVNGNEIISRNVPWPIIPARLRGLGIVELAAVNDFVAVAHADQCMNEADTTLLTPTVAGHAPGPALVIGPGTGLGAALRVPLGARTLVLPSEPHQMALAPENLRELAVLGYWMRSGVAHIGLGHAISGPGLLNIHRALCALEGTRPQLHSSDDVSIAAETGADSIAVEAMAMFCGWFGSIVGDLAMATGATRVFIAGGVSSKIKPHLCRGPFAARMVAKDLMRPVLEQVPVRLVEDPDLGVIGAASWFLRRGS